MGSGLLAVLAGLRMLQYRKLKSSQEIERNEKPRICAFRGPPEESERRGGARDCFFWLVAAWVKSRAERPSVSVVNRQLHVQIGCKLGIRNRKDELKQAKRNKLQIKPEGN